MLLSLDATCYCDGCGGRFVVEIDDVAHAATNKVKSRGEIDAAIAEAIATRQVKGGGFASIRPGGRMLCVSCTAWADADAEDAEADRQDAAVDASMAMEPA